MYSYPKKIFEKYMKSNVSAIYLVNSEYLCDIRVMPQHQDFNIIA